MDNKFCWSEIEILKTWQDILENNQQYVRVKWTLGVQFDCVVYDIYTV